MIWNPFRFVQTVLHFRVGDPLRSLQAAIAPNPKSMATTTSAHTALGPTSLPATVLVAGAELPASKVTLIEQFGYSLQHQTADFSPKADLQAGSMEALVNVPLVVWIPPDTAPENSQRAFQQFINDLSQRSTYQQAILVNLHNPAPSVKELWGALDDVVMGGVSASQGQWNDGLVFTGNVSTANSGGFASIRTRNINPPLNLAQWQGTVLQAEGDGQRYKWILRDGEGWDSPAYCYSFDTTTGHPQAVRVPFLDMVATFRARTIPEASPLNPASIYSMQVMLSKFEYDGNLNPAFQPGSFKLTLHSIGVYREAAKPLILFPKLTTTDPIDPYRDTLANAGLYGIQPAEDGFSVIGAGSTLPGWIEADQVGQLCRALADG
jgi:hypothetical protein